MEMQVLVSTILFVFFLGWPRNLGEMIQVDHIFGP